MWASLAKKSAALPQTKAAPAPASEPTTTATTTATAGATADTTGVESKTMATPAAAAAPAVVVQESATISTLVLDSGAVIAGKAMNQLANKFGIETTYVTCDSVLAEIKDSASRQAVHNFPFQIETRAISAKARSAVERFAALTGDAHALSGTDIDVLALAYMIERERHGDKNVDLSPPATRITAITTPAGQSSSTEVQSRVTDLLARPVNAFSLDTIVFGTPTTTTTTSKQDINRLKVLTTATESNRSEEILSTIAASQENVVQLVNEQTVAVSVGIQAVFDDENDGLESEAEGGKWITDSNVFNARYDLAGEKIVPKAVNNVAEIGKSSTVACITTDYSMQNVLLQMGMRLYSVNGYAIKSVKTWLKKCHTCNTLVRNNARMFCPACGGHSLLRTPVKIGENGLVTLANPNYVPRINTRGTIYAIPRRTGGRRNNDIALREDSLFKKGFSGLSNSNRDKYKKFDGFEDATTLDRRSTRYSEATPVYGYGRHNPNVSGPVKLNKNPLNGKAKKRRNKRRNRGGK